MEDAELLSRADRLSELIPEITKRLHAIPTRPLPTPALSIPQLRMLVLLEREGQTTMGELARRASVTMPTATSSINALVAGRYVSRRRSPRDRRLVLVSLRAKGRQVLDRFRAERRQRLIALFGHLTAEDQERLVQAFEAILEVLRKLD